MRQRLIFRIWVGIIVLSGMLALDLTNQGLFWQFAWSVTGEEAPVAQLRGIPQWLMTQVRSKPRTEPLVPIDHTEVNPYGINTFLQLEVEEPKLEVAGLVYEVSVQDQFALVCKTCSYWDLRYGGDRADANGDCGQCSDCVFAALHDTLLAV